MAVKAIGKRQRKKTPFDAVRFITQTAKFVKDNVGSVVGLCLFAILLFLAMIVVAFILNPDLIEAIFDGAAFHAIRVVVIIIDIYVGISTVDYIVNAILLKLPTDMVENIKKDFSVRMNYMVVRADSNMISSGLIRFFNLITVSPTIINSPSVNFLFAFLSIFGAVIVLIINNVLMWLFNKFIMPLIKPFLRKIEREVTTPAKKKVTKAIRNVQDKAEDSFEELGDKLKKKRH